MTTAKVSDKYQIAIPKEVREKIKLRKGTSVFVYTDGDTVYIWKKPKDYVKAMLGLGKDTWSGKGEEFLKKERESWD